ncbi:MAG TPA: hypothetical protein VGS96_02695 [Thermoanaerobaculia bacterium]|jgi:hypothetical protein|nr:hypothetical protein [Thermoanaerobaculia bacterium]
MLNIAGPEYDFGQVVFVVLQECEHRRRSFATDSLGRELESIARYKLGQIKRAYDEFGGSAGYWETLQKEVLDTALPQYITAAAEMNEMERNGFGVFRRGDVAARLILALAGLVIGSIIIALPFIPIFEELFAFALTAVGFFYPDIVRFTWERRYARLLNRLITDADRYQSNARLHYMTTEQIRESFTPGESQSLLPPGEGAPERSEGPDEGRGSG